MIKASEKADSGFLSIERTKVSNSHSCMHEAA